jgi:hypothetical protein
MQSRGILLALIAWGVPALIVPSAHSQALPSISTNVTASTNTGCAWNTASGTTLYYLGTYVSTCTLSGCPGKTWSSSPATLSEASTGSCNYVSGTQVLVGLNATSQQALANALGWPNMGAPNFGYQTYIDGPSGSSYVLVNFTNFATQTVTVTVSIAGVGVSVVVGVTSLGTTSYPAGARMTCTIPN